MAFWAHQNIIYDYAVIHRGECPQCNNGKGAPDGENRHVYHWAGPFHSFHAASRETSAKGLEVSTCEECKPK